MDNYKNETKKIDNPEDKTKKLDNPEYKTKKLDNPEDKTKKLDNKSDETKKLNKFEQFVHNIDLDKISENLKDKNLILNGHKKIKNKYIRQMIVGFFMAISILIALGIANTYFQSNTVGVTYEYKNIKHIKNTPYATMIEMFKINKHRVALFSFLNQNKMEFVLFDMDAKKILMDDSLENINISKNSTMVLSQILPTILKENKKITSLEKSQNGFIVNKNKEYNVELNSIYVSKLNDKENKYKNVYFISKSYKDLIQRNKIDTSKLDIGFAEYDSLENAFVFAGINKDNKKIYTFKQFPDGLIKLEIKPTK